MTAAPTRVPWNRRVLSTLMLVFLAGAASGALSMQLGLHGWLHRTVSTPPPTTNRVTLVQLKGELGLSQEQSAKIANVLGDYTRYYQDLQEQIDDVRSTGRTQILEILNPDQRDKFEKMGQDIEAPAK